MKYYASEQALLEENHEIVVLDVDLFHLSESMSLELDKLGGKLNEIENLTIFPVPYRFRQSKENLFDPSVVSIGPLHHGKESLKAMQDQKWRSLRDFLSRGNHITLDLCLSEMKNLEERTRRCYSERVPMDSNSFVEMMLLDGCFVLEYFLKWYERRLIGSVFVLSDLLLLENQIPFFIVEKLCEIGLKPQAIRDHFRKYLVYIFAHAGPTPIVLYDSKVQNPTNDSKVPNPPAEIHHFIHLCYHSLIPINPKISIVSSSESFFPSMLSSIKNWLLDFILWVLTRIFAKRNSLRYRLSFPKSTLIPCATELRNVGIKLRAKSNPNHMLDISFHHSVLEIPALTITNDSKTLLANLVAFEQCKLNENQEMHANLSSFALFWDSLVNTPEDVKILKKCGIVNNCLDSDEELTNFFNQIWKGMSVEKDHFMADLFSEVTSYYISRWSKRQAIWIEHKSQFIDTYLSSPWKAISLVAAVVIVLLTFLQTFFAIYAYFVPPS